MDLTFSNFIIELIKNPAFFISSFLILGVVLSNGWTDSPNAVATCVGTRSLSPKKALILCNVFNFLGMFIMTFISSNVAQTIYSIANWGDNSVNALIGLCAAMFAIVFWSILTWFFGIPTSGSHSLIAGLSGSAIAIGHGLSGINFDEWKKVLYGLVLSTFLGFILGYAITKLIEKICKHMDRRKTIPFFKKSQIFSSAAMAFMDGAQDGQKFMGLFLIGLALANGVTNVDNFYIPIWLIFLCSITMSIGTIIGGYKLIKSVGMNMVKLEPYQGTASDLAAAGCLLISNLAGLPISTSQTKSTAIMGVGASKRLSYVNWKFVKNVVLAWVLTFPGCGLLGYGITALFIKIFA